MLPQLSQFVVHLAALVPTLLMLLRAFCFLMGIILTGHALYQWYALSQAAGQYQMQQGNVMAPFVEIIVAGFLLALARDIVVQKIIASWVSSTNFQMPASLSYQAQDSISGIRMLIGLALENMMFLTGTLAIVRGLLVLKNSAYKKGQASVGVGMSYLLFAAFALNFKATIGLIDGGFGFQMSKFLF